MGQRALGTKLFEAALLLADHVLEQSRRTTGLIETTREDHVLGAWEGDRCAGSVRFFVQVIGAEKRRPPVFVDEPPLTEGFVEAFEVSPDYGAAVWAPAMTRLSALPRLRGRGGLDIAPPGGEVRTAGSAHTDSPRL